VTYETAWFALLNAEITCTNTFSSSDFGAMTISVAMSRFPKDEILQPGRQFRMFAKGF
jgi:hypothetical protein